MAKACHEIGAFHYENNADIKALYDRHGFRPAEVKSIGLEKIPPLGVQAMKYFLFTTLPHEQAVLKLTSSGTRGQKTQIWFDQPSLDRAQSMLDGLWEQQGLKSAKPANYLMFIYDPAHAKDLGIAFSIANQQRFAPIADTYFAIRKNAEDQWYLDMAGVMAKLDQYSREDHGLRIHGIPSFIFEFIQNLRQLGRKFKFPQGLILTGGGWKAAEDKKVSKEEFYRQVEDVLGIPHQHILDGYGMAEHSAPYMECSLHRFHIPAYCRLIIRDPRTMAVMPRGEPGLIELVSPFNTMMPNLAVLSTDVGFIDQDACPCGYTSPTFTLVGRGGLVKHRGCAITAAEIVKRNS
jgi:phenylacetate-coenzyme A ligase PaaK-like adenylate-forming protein